MKPYIVNNQFIGNSLMEFLVSDQMEMKPKEYSTKNLIWGIKRSPPVGLKGGYEMFVAGAFGFIDVILRCSPACKICKYVKCG